MYEFLNKCNAGDGDIVKDIYLNNNTNDKQIITSYYPLKYKTCKKIGFVTACYYPRIMYISLEMQGGQTIKIGDKFVLHNGIEISINKIYHGDNYGIQIFNPILSNNIRIGEVYKFVVEVENFNTSLAGQYVYM